MKTADRRLPHNGCRAYHELITVYTIFESKRDIFTTPNAE